MSFLRRVDEYGGRTATWIGIEAWRLASWLMNRASRDPKQERVFLLLASGERRIKRVQRLARGALYLISDNELYQPEMIKPQDMGHLKILGGVRFALGGWCNKRLKGAGKWGNLQL
ncbi:S24 family peptidase [Vreelandella malpeensis]|uniref:S24 family peptidase n=1 Tax=Vreelandella malpeensis TaxID=1172368 RepID=UPI00361729B3